MTHTPGPWEADHYGHVTAITKLGNKRQIADVRQPENARLIAAAPDLLEALQIADEIMDVEGACYCEGNGLCRYHRWARKAQDAIAKATGQEVPA